MARQPKQKCCLSKPRCTRCPIRMLGEGTLSAKDAKKLFAKGRNRKALKKSGLKAPTARSATPGLGSAA